MSSFLKSHNKTNKNCIFFSLLSIVLCLRINENKQTCRSFVGYQDEILFFFSILIILTYHQIENTNIMLL